MRIRDSRLPPQCNEICARLGYYAALSGNYVPTFRDNLSVPFQGSRSPKRKKCQEVQEERLSSSTSWPLKMVPAGCPETSVQNYHSKLRNI
jgi:hypothetical protein